jgi:predicted RNA-binding protein with PIN domain
LPYLIDGHNLLWSIRKNDERFEPVDDVGLCATLGLYLRDMHETGDIVFDGQGPPNKALFRQIPGLRVIFSGRDREADTIIEEMIEVCRTPKKLYVISSDRRVRKAGRSVKAALVKSDEFWQAVLKRLLRKRPIKEPAGKRQGLSRSETEQWLKRFGFES